MKLKRSIEFVIIKQDKREVLAALNYFCDYDQNRKASLIRVLHDLNELKQRGEISSVVLASTKTKYLISDNLR